MIIYGMMNNYIKYLGYYFLKLSFMKIRHLLNPIKHLVVLCLMMGFFFVGGIGGGVLGNGALAASNNTSTSYELHEKIPGQEGVDTLQKYLEGLYKFGISIAAILAVVMVGVGAFIYIVSSAGNVGKMLSAKDIITNALIGLVMVFVAWLILFIINPDLVGNTLHIQDKPDVNLVGDGEPDPVCEKMSNRAENGWCSGDKFCIEGQCVYKKDICPLPDEYQVNNFCPTAGAGKYYADNGQSCGLESVDGLIGVCQTSPCDLSNGEYEITVGKKCIKSNCCYKP